MITTAPGILLSPGFPNVYGHNLRCNYTLSMEPQHYIILEFDQLNFNIEGKWNSREPDNVHFREKRKRFHFPAWHHTDNFAIHADW